MASRQSKPAIAGRSRIRFLLKKHIDQTETISYKTETGSMRVSNLEATALDLLRYPSHAGGLNNIALVLAGLAQKNRSPKTRSDRAGEVVTGEELQAKLWKGGTFADFENGLGLNAAVKKLRRAIPRSHLGISKRCHGLDIDS